MVKGLALAILTYAFLIAWVAKIAERRGRLWLAWAGLAAVIGATAIVGGVVFISIAFDENGSMAGMLLVVLSPLFAMVASMAAIAGVLVRLPIATSTRTFRIHDMTAGGTAGEVQIRDAHVTIAWPASTQTIPVVALREIAADGECIRLSWNDGDAIVERTYLMGGKPDNAEGRKRQSETLARQLRGPAAPRAEIHRG